ncbi:MAG: hypothetical protein MK183_13810 [Verrucomicrobiales bacterium]|nr:hypothetical protein [Verrucomicrobiales bacterium]
MGCRLIQLALFLVITVMMPLLLRLEAGHNYNDPRHMRRLTQDLRSKNPEILLIGNSMLYTRIDLGVLEQISGKRISMLSKGGTASACWYLYLKNVIAQSGIRPKQVIIFFRDRVLTWPEYRTAGHYAEYLQSLQVEQEPLISQILDNRQSSPSSLPPSIRSVYGINTQPDRLQSKLNDLAFDLTKAGREDEQRRQFMNKRFGVDNLRGDLLLENTANNAPGQQNHVAGNFSPDPEKSFLPHMIDLGKKLKTNLCFYRVKNGNERVNQRLSAGQMKYFDDLASYLEERQVLLLEEAGELIQNSWFAEGDHISKKHRAEFTRWFWNNVRDSLQAIQ